MRVRQQPDGPGPPGRRRLRGQPFQESKGAGTAETTRRAQLVQVRHRLDYNQGNLEPDRHTAGTYGPAGDSRHLPESSAGGSHAEGRQGAGPGNRGAARRGRADSCLRLMRRSRGRRRGPDTGQQGKGQGSPGQCRRASGTATGTAWYANARNGNRPRPAGSARRFTRRDFQHRNTGRAPLPQSWVVVKLELAQWYSEIHILAKTSPHSVSKGSRP